MKLDQADQTFIKFIDQVSFEFDGWAPVSNDLYLLAERLDPMLYIGIETSDGFFLKLTDEGQRVAHVLQTWIK